MRWNIAQKGQKGLDECCTHFLQLILDLAKTPANECTLANYQYTGKLLIADVVQNSGLRIIMSKNSL